ncbi:MAG TPA: alpha/beta fold hydrolase [Steroidobacteraceae bacterium]|jgi:pimeloyl-ACP methyl ester carboxylesterase|nr:alpha/beta fold hydrolase [Steroidobacteraceae bacterium]
MNANPLRDAGPAPALVILVHGLWQSGLELFVMRRRLQADGSLRALFFSYPTTVGTMSNHVRRLIDCARAHKAEQLHFVGHSLGGLVVLRALEITDDLPPGRAVLLGSPLQGSRTAQSLARLPFGRALLGGALTQECVDWSPREWSGRREVGVIAGSMGFGVGRLLANLDAAHDGTVLVEETRLPGAKDHMVVAASHTGLLVSAQVAEQTRHFLDRGVFKRTA